MRFLKSTATTALVQSTALMESLSGKKVHKSALAIVPRAGELYNAIQGIRTHHDKQINRWPPHINILYPFVPESDFETAAALLHSALEDVPPFDVCFSRFNHFRHGPKSHTMWLAPEAVGGEPSDRPQPHPELVRVQAAAQAAIPFCDDQTARFGSFTPHLSVGQFGSREEVEAFLSGQAWESAMLRVEEVCLMRRTGAENPFEVIWRVPLGKRGPPTRAQVVESAKADMEDVLEVDGSFLEGGGQILRVSSALATILKRSICIQKIRAGRPKPGLQPQHLTGLKLLADVGQSDLQGGNIGSTEVVLRPGAIQGGRFMADTRTAGSVTLLLQAVLPCMAMAPAPSSCSLRGGTTVPFSPPLAYFLHVTQPLLARMGLDMSISVARRGYYPMGGGDITCTVRPAEHAVTPIELLEAGKPSRATLHVCGIVGEGLRGLVPAITGAMEGVVREQLGLDRLSVDLALEEGRFGSDVRGGHGGGRRGGGWRGGRGQSRGPREVLSVLLVVETEAGAILAVDDLLEGPRLQSADALELSRGLVGRMKEYLDSGAACDEHTADQVVVYMALAKGLSRVRAPPTRLLTSDHLRTAIAMAEMLTGAKFIVTDDGGPLLIECEGIGFKQ